jgi:hypothetical protein
MGHNTVVNVQQFVVWYDLMNGGGDLEVALVRANTVGYAIVTLLVGIGTVLLLWHIGKRKALDKAA